MNASSATKLYTPEILALAVNLAEFAFTGELPQIGEARSKTCGSEVSIELRADESGQIEELGLRVTACAIGQASAAICAQSLVGKSADDIESALAEIEQWLAGGDRPDWPGIEVLGAALAHPARHGAITLAWRAALNALCSSEKAR